MSTLYARRGVAAKVGFGVVGLYLFVLALKVMQTAAGGLGSHLEFLPGAGGFLKALAVGWGGAMLVLSGSPVAAASLTLFDRDVLNPAQTFAMITGSRLGATFVILAVGLLYFARRRDAVHMSVGITTLVMTVVCYVPGVALAYGLWSAGFTSLGGSAPGLVSSQLDHVVGPVVGLLRSVPALLLFPIGLAMLVGGGALLERGLPSLDDRRLLPNATGARRQWMWFVVGSAVAFMTMSVSVSLTILIPLLAKGIVRREEIVPYVAGANVTTLADTLAAAMLLGNPGAAAIVAAEAAGVLAVTLLLFGVFGIERVERRVARLVDQVIYRPRRLAVALGTFALLPAFAVAGVGRVGL